MKTPDHLKNLLVAEFGNEFKTQIGMIVDRTIEFVEEWIPIEKELPCNCEILWKGEFHYDKGYFDLTELTRDEIAQFVKKNEATHWRPILHK